VESGQVATTAALGSTPWNECTNLADSNNIFCIYEVLDLLKRGLIRPFYTEYRLEDAAKAHEDMERGVLCWLRLAATSSFFF
jgi:hypothetical protein